MTELEYWRARILQLTHDPPGKPYARWHRSAGATAGEKGGHERLAADLLQALVEYPAERVPKQADHAATGADRPNLGFGFGDEAAKSEHRICRVLHWQTDPIITHPLSPGPLLQLGAAAGEESPAIPKSLESLESIDQEQLKRLRPKEANLTQLELAQVIGKKLGSSWDDVDSLRGLYGYLWRRFRQDLMDADRKNAVLWALLPADTRCPDHSVWDHTRMTAAASFLARPSKEELPEECAPWFLSFKIGPVTEFIAEARTSRDLWVGSYLLADCAWYSLLPILRHYGPDAILYPDLRGNPRADAWLQDHSELFGSLQDGAFPRSRAALIPNHWVALLPRGPLPPDGATHSGAEEHSRPLEAMAAKCMDALARRWQEHAEKVWEKLKPFLKRAANEREIDLNEMHTLWEKQHAHVLRATWAAVPWERHPGMDFIAPPGGGLPAQDRSWLTKKPEPVEQREERLRPWISSSTWSAYEFARNQQAEFEPRLMKLERGFDYALTHHQLLAWHGQRSNARVYPEADAFGRGDRCTICHHRAALGPAGEQHIDAQRQRLREFWQRLGERLNEPRWGSERLCAVCLFKRLLVPFGDPESDRDDFNRPWSSADPGVWRVRPGTAPDPVRNRLRMPFPSTALIAGQEFLHALTAAPDLLPLCRQVAASAKKISWPRTQFPAELPRLRAAANRGEEWLEYDAQIFHPNALEAELRRQRGRELDTDPDAQSLLDAVRKLRRAAFDPGSGSAIERQDARRAISPPGTRYAVIALDGDHLGELLLGTPGAIRNPWRRVLHPAAVEQVKDNKNWGALLDEPRQTGPALHALITRALAEFAHRIVPWVVEQEFGGRLIYAGGDDVLALAPASDALGIASRLQQLYSAPWVLDTQPGKSAWDRETTAWNPRLARKRFLVAAADPRARDARIRLPLKYAAQHPEEGRLGGDHIRRLEAQSGEILPLLGPFQSLSAGIAFGHFKTPLQGAIQAAHHLLHGVAKETVGRSGFALAIWTRSGIKVEAGLRWRSGDWPSSTSAIAAMGTETGESFNREFLAPPENALRIRRVIAGFESGRIPGRLPYKLREAVCAMGEIFAPPPPVSEARPELTVEQTQLLRGLLTIQAGEGNLTPTTLEDLLLLWQEDLAVAWRQQRPTPTQPLDLTPKSILICRDLAHEGEEEQ
jgi:CRISPR-associated protein Cmr2